MFPLPFPDRFYILATCPVFGERLNEDVEEEDDAILVDQGIAQCPQEVQPGETFTIDDGYEGALAEPEDGSRSPRIIDPSASPPDDEITEEWGLAPGTYHYDAEKNQIVKTE